MRNGLLTPLHDAPHDNQNLYIKTIFISYEGRIYQFIGAFFDRLRHREWSSCVAKLARGMYCKYKWKSQLQC